MTDPGGGTPAEQEIGPLDDGLAEHTQRQRDWVRGHLSPESAGLYDQAEHKLRLIQTILDNNWIQADETWKLQALGVTLGDLIVQQSPMEWVQVSDQYGTDPALAVPRTSLLMFPLTMISKRIESGESVDVAAISRFVLDQITAVLSKIQATAPETN